MVVGVGFLVCVGAAADTLSGRVVRIVYGDTFVLLISGHDQGRIRLAGIDCPERREAFGTRAKEALARLAAGKEVTVEREKRVGLWRDRDPVPLWEWRRGRHGR